MGNGGKSLLFKLGGTNMFEKATSSSLDDGGSKKFGETSSAVNFGEILKRRLTSPEVSQTVFERGNNFLMGQFLKRLASLRKNQSNLFESRAGDYVYKIGVIDFLTSYTAAKKFETKLNTVLHWSESE